MATATSTAISMQLQPYIFFYGRCEEALEYYKDAIGGVYELQRMSEAPPGDDPGRPRRSEQ